MAKERKKAPDDENGASSKRDEELESESGTGSESDNDSRRSGGSRHSRRSRSKRKRSRSLGHNSRDDEEDSYTSSSESESSDSYSDSESGSSEDNSESEGDRKRRRRKERRKREEREKEKKRRRRKEKEKEKKRRRKEREEKRRKKHKEKKKKRDKEKGKKGAVTNSWGKYGIIRETDMWNKRPEFTAWLAEVKQVNLESLPNWEEKQMFKEFMEDHNTATFPSKKYYNLDAYHRHQMEKEMKRSPRKIQKTERTVFNDEEQRRQELLREREILKEEQVEALKRSMQGGLAQAMKEQAQLKEEMAYQYKIGNFEAAAAIQRRLDPDIPM